MSTLEKLFNFNIFTRVQMEKNWGDTPSATLIILFFGYMLTYMKDVSHQAEMLMPIFNCMLNSTCTLK